MLNKILEDLEFLEIIPKGYKPNFSDKTLTSTNEWFSTFKRRYKSEKGEKGVMYVENLIENIESVCKNLDHSSLKLLKEKLVTAILGLNNLIYTYKIDEQISVSDGYINCKKRIENIIEKIKPKFFNHCPKIVFLNEHSREDNE